MLWMFYKDGLMTDIGVIDFTAFHPGIFSADDNTIYLGRSSSKVSLRTLKKLNHNTTNLEKAL